MASSAWTVVLLVALIGSQSAGNVSCISMAVYEKYGADPMKRNVTNQLLSSIWIAGMVANLFLIPSITWRMLISPLQSTTATICYLAIGAAYYYIMLASTQVVILKVLYIKFWSRMAATSDNFFAVFLTSCNIMWISLMIGIVLQLGEYLTNPLDKYLSGDDSSSNIEAHELAVFYFADLFFSFCVMVILVGLLVIKREKRKTANILSTPNVSLSRPSSVAEEAGNQPNHVVFFNTKKFNDNIFDETTIGIMGCLFAIGIETWWFFVSSSESEDQKEMTMATLVIFQFCLFTIVPCIYFARNKQHAQRVLEHFDLM